MGRSGNSCKKRFEKRFGSTPFNASNLSVAGDANASDLSVADDASEDPSTASSTFANAISNTSAGDEIVSAVIELRLPETRFEFWRVIGGGRSYLEGFPDDTPDTVADARADLALDATNPSSMRNLMGSLLHWSPTEGVAFMQARLRNGSTNPSDRHFLVRCLRAAGDLEQADGMISDFLRAFPLDVDLHLEQARLQLAQGNPTVAEGTMHGATRLSTAKGNPYPYLLLAEKYARDGDDEGVGAALFQAAAVDDTGDTVAFTALTDFLGHDIPDKLRDEVEANNAWPAGTQDWVTTPLHSRHELKRTALVTSGPSEEEQEIEALHIGLTSLINEQLKITRSKKP